MAGISRYEKRVLGLTAVFLLLVGGLFLARQNQAVPWQVSVPAQTEELPQTGDDRPDSLLPDEVIDLNGADAYDLGRLPGIGEKRAAAIVAYRAEHGPFQRVDDLLGVEGIGPGILTAVKPYVTAGSGT